MGHIRNLELRNRVAMILAGLMPVHGFGGCPGPILKDFNYSNLEPASHAEPKAQWVRMRGLGDEMAIDC